MDRFLAVYWNVEYKQRVTTKMAKISCGASMIIGLIIIAFVAVFDPSYIRCTENYRNLKARPINRFLIYFPRLFVALVLSFVSIYVSVVKVRLDNKVNPVVNISTMPEDTSRIQRIDEDPNMINIDRGISNLGASSSKSNPAQRPRNEEMDEEVSPVVNFPTMEEKDPVHAENASRVKRVNEDPNMFYQVDIVHGTPFVSASSSKTSQAQTERNDNQLKEPTTCFVIHEGENPTTCLPLNNSEIMLVIKEILTNNLITAILIIAILPKIFLDIICFHTELDVSVFKYLITFRIILVTAHASLIYRKLTKNT